MTIQELKNLRESGKFHHATYRNLGTLWEGLWIYTKDDTIRGFAPVGCFPKGDPNEELAYDYLRGTGISVGAFGQG